MDETASTKEPERAHLDSSGQLLAGIEPPAPASPSFVYALGQIKPRFPSLAVEKEFAQVTGRAELAGLTDHEALRAVLSDWANRYLARQLCWVFVIEGVETYLLAPRDSADLDLMVETVRSRPHPTDLDMVIGVLGPLAPPEACDGGGTPRPHPTDGGQRRSHRRAPGVELPGGPVPRHLRADRIGARQQRLTNRGRRPPIPVARGPHGPRRHLFLHPPADRCHREVLRPGGRDRGIPFLVTKLSPYYNR